MERNGLVDKRLENGMDLYRKRIGTLKVTFYRRYDCGEICKGQSQIK